jgi:hypothetical protein
MADKNFKVKTGLDLPAPLPVEQGGTGQTSTANTINALLPIQTDNNGKFLVTDGTNISWGVPAYSIIQNNGTPVTTRSNLNIIGATIVDDSENNRTTVTLSGGGGVSIGKVYFMGGS